VLCSNGHYMIASFDRGICPVCELTKELELLKGVVANLERDLTELENKMKERMK
jgi:hypothetical protein